MKPHKTKLILFLALTTVLSACDPATIDPDSISAASGNDSSLGLFQLVSENFDEGTLTNGDISVSNGEQDQDGHGTASSPLTFGLGTKYTISWQATIPTDSKLKFSLYLPDNPDIESPLAEVDCSSMDCENPQEIICWFTGDVDTHHGYNTAFFCKHDDNILTAIASQEAMAYDFLPDWSGEWVDLDLTVGLKMSLCDSSSETICDVGTLGYLKLTEYKE